MLYIYIYIYIYMSTNLHSHRPTVHRQSPSDWLPVPDRPFEPLQSSDWAQTPVDIIWQFEILTGMRAIPSERSHQQPFNLLPYSPQFSPYAHRMFLDHNWRYLPKNRRGSLNEVEAGDVGGNLHLPFAGHQVQLHQTLQREKVRNIRKRENEKKREE